jgi:subtilisin family serine protease
MRLGFRHAAALAAALASGSAAAAERAQFRAQALEPTDSHAGFKSADGRVSVIVKWDAEPAATYRGGIAGLVATSPEATGLARLDAASPAVKAYDAFLAAKENAFQAEMQRVVPEGRIVHRFRKIIGGVSVVLPADKVGELRRLPGVKAVYPDALLSLDTDRSPEFIGAPVLWNSVGGQSEAGRGIIVGILDSGIWPEHPSVADTGFPAPPAKWTGTDCNFNGSTSWGNNPGDPFTCNNKLIGASRFMATFDTFFGGAGTPLAGEFTSARDNNGHGSHTATTAAGNSGVTASTGTVVSGIAPQAHLAVYKICFTIPDGRGSCYTSDSAAAIEQSILDGVDVLNFSIGGGTSPFADAASLAFLDAYAAGVFVACSAGNSGPAVDTVGHREPWVTTVAATTTDKGFAGSASLLADNADTLDLTGVSSTANVGPGTVVIAGDYEDGVTGAPAGNACSAIAEDETDRLCCNPFPANTFPAGSIVVCKRGTNARVAKGANVLAGGAAGMILYNPTPGSLNADVHALPALHIDDVQGASLMTFLGGHTGETGSIVGGGADLSGAADLVASFSSRGGVNQVLGVSKPDIGAPGVNILAANTPAPAGTGALLGTLYQIISGTSMASPHVAGAAAVMKQLHPTWTPGQIKSALMTTANFTAPVNEGTLTPATPFDVGSGRMDLAVAGSPGFVISETADNFVTMQNNLSVANYPSLYVPKGAGKVTVSRFLRWTDGNRKWTVTAVAPPDLKVFVPGEIKMKGNTPAELIITVDASLVPVGQARHAQLQFASKGRIRTFPISVVRRNGDVTLVKTCGDTQLNIGETTPCSITMANAAFADAEVKMIDRMPAQVRVAGATGATSFTSAKIVWNGTLPAAQAPVPSIGTGSSPAGGYFALSGLGITPISGTGDETIHNFNVPAFNYGGQTYTRLGMVSNGYVVVGGGTSADVQFVNQSLPNPAVPNNVLAPFWTDLRPGAAPGAGAMRIGLLTDGVSSWIVCEWEGVKNFSDATTNSFQVWIGYASNADNEDISFVYDSTGSGDGGFLTVGAENFNGSEGANFYVDGTGTLPTSTTELVVDTAPGVPGGSHTVNFTMVGNKKGLFDSCAHASTNLVFGTVAGCVSGEVLP